MESLFPGQARPALEHSLLDTVQEPVGINFLFGHGCCPVARNTEVGITTAFV